MSRKPAKKLIPLLMMIFTVAGFVGFIYEEICGFINEGHFWRHLKKMRASYALRRQWLESALQAQGVGAIS